MSRAEHVKHLFYLLQVAFGFGVALYFLFLRSREPKSAFRVREEDLRKPEEARFPAPNVHKTTGPSRSKPKPPLQLAGLRIDGAAHEILGVAPGASAREIQKAYRDLIKRFHPDVVGRPGSREWADAQKIAEAINRAKDEMLLSHRKKR